ncbi:Membrane-spanning 4-domains subfamily A member 5, partial [Galemys pyrenaicus]
IPRLCDPMVPSFQDDHSSASPPHGQGHGLDQPECQRRLFFFFPFQNTNYTIMYETTADTPVFLVFPPEITVPEFQSVDVTETSYGSHVPNPKLLSTKLKVIGSVQILLGLMNFSFGVILLFTLESTQSRFPFIFLSGYPFWSSILFINSGAFLVALERKATETMVKMSRFVNLLSAVAAMAGVFLITFAFILDQDYLCGFAQNAQPCHAVTTLFVGILVMLMTFTVIELFISATISILSSPFVCCECEDWH